MKEVRFKRVDLLIAFLLAIFTLNAAKAPMKFGKVDLVDLEMKTYAPDTSAAAVILCNYGYFDSNNLQFVHQIRIKILKDEGKSWGDYIAPAAENAMVKGQTTNLENGTPVVTKLRKAGLLFFFRISSYYFSLFQLWKTQVIWRGRHL